MRVICIEERADDLANLFDLPPLVVGEVYTVVRFSEYSLNKYGVSEYFPVYCLAERGFHVGYATTRFAPLSEINEKEFERNYNFQTV